MKAAKRAVVLVGILLWGLGGFGQKHDYQWLFGYENSTATTNDTIFGGVTIDFNYDIMRLNKHLRLGDFDECDVSYCNDTGKLLFYSNCGDIFNGRDSVMSGGDSINYGWLWNVIQGNSDNRYEGLRISQGALALPSPSDSSQIYLCHYSVELSAFPDGSSAYLTDTSYFSLIDMSGDSGYGNVIRKDQVINYDTLSYALFSAVQHGNGKDWWVIHPYYNTNCYYEFLLNDTGINLYSIQCIGDNQLGWGALGSSCFSPDGSKYFWVNSVDGIKMFDFDRCTGLLSNPQSIPFPSPGFGDSVVLAAGIAVSPNNRFLYIVANIVLLQYDLQAPDIGASVDTVGLWDGFYDPYPYFASTFYLAQLGPDGKIYINCLNSIEYLHVINRPDEKGDSCLFTQHSLWLDTYNSSSLPNFPNYRLGPLSGSSCDTVFTEVDEVRIASKERILKVFPNPANDIVTVDYGFTNWSKGGVVSLEIVNELGQRVYRQPLPQYSGYQQIDVSRYADGVYTAYIKRNAQVIATQQFAKE